MSDKIFKLYISENYVGQILDGIRCREAAYRRTAEYLNSEMTTDPYFACEEVKDAEETLNLAATYQEIIDLVEQQLRAHKK